MSNSSHGKSLTIIRYLVDSYSNSWGSWLILPSPHILQSGLLFPRVARLKTWKREWLDLFTPFSFHFPLWILLNKLTPDILPNNYVAGREEKATAMLRKKNKTSLEWNDRYKTPLIWLASRKCVRNFVLSPYFQTKRWGGSWCDTELGTFRKIVIVAWPAAGTGIEYQQRKFCVKWGHPDTLRRTTLRKTFQQFKNI